MNNRSKCREKAKLSERTRRDLAILKLRFQLNHLESSIAMRIEVLRQTLDQLVSKGERK